MSKHYLCSYFTEEEISTLNDFYTGLTLNDLEKDCFLNLAIFFKYYLVIKRKMNLEFNSVVFNHLISYYDSIKDFDLFNGVSENIFANSFFTPENIKRIQSEIIEAQKKQRKFKANHDLSHFTEVSIPEETFHAMRTGKFKFEKKEPEYSKQELEKYTSDNITNINYNLKEVHYNLLPIEMHEAMFCISRRLKSSLLPEDETFILNKIRNSLVHNLKINTSDILMYTQLKNPDKEVLKALKKLLVNNTNVAYGPGDTGKGNPGKIR